MSTQGVPEPQPELQRSHSAKKRAEQSFWKYLPKLKPNARREQSVWRGVLQCTVWLIYLVDTPIFEFCDAKFIFHQLVFMLNYVKKLLPRSADCCLSCNHVCWFRNESDSFSPLYNIPKNMCTTYNQLYISFLATGLFLLGLAENSCQEWITLAKKESFNNFPLNTSQT